MKQKWRGHIFLHLCLLCAQNLQPLSHQNHEVPKLKEIWDHLFESCHFQDLTNEASELNPLSQTDQLLRDTAYGLGCSLSCTNPCSWMGPCARDNGIEFLQRPLPAFDTGKGKKERLAYSPFFFFNRRTSWESACTFVVEQYYFTQHCIWCWWRDKVKTAGIPCSVDPLIAKKILAPLSAGSDLGEGA